MKKLVKNQYQTIMLSFSKKVKNNCDCNFCMFFRKKLRDFLYRKYIGMSGDNCSQKVAKIFVCESCDYKTSKMSDYNKHLLTNKHKILQNTTNSYIKQYKCPCGKQYKHSSTLYAHKKTCNKKQQNNLTSVDDIKKNIDPYELVSYLLKNDSEFKQLLLEQNSQMIEQNKQIIELAKNSGNNNNNTTNNTTNNNNNNFNINFYLNETCKNAMNITDFINSLQLQLSDLENVGKLGYVDGISSIIVKNLNALDETTRPIHCTDKKRETFYIKDEDKWEKDDEEKKKIKKVINNVAYKNEKLLTKFKELHPGCNFSDSKYADQYSKLVIEAMGGAGNNDAEKADKIIRKIAKEVTIDKGVDID